MSQPKTSSYDDLFLIPTEKLINEIKVEYQSPETNKEKIDEKKDFKINDAIAKKFNELDEKINNTINKLDKNLDETIDNKIINIIDNKIDNIIKKATERKVVAFSDNLQLFDKKTEELENRLKSAAFHDEVQQLKDSLQKMEQVILKQLESNKMNQQLSTRSLESTGRKIQQLSTRSLESTGRKMSFVSAPDGPPAMDELDQDVFGLMMMTSPLSKPWCLGLVSFALQATLGMMVILDLTKNEFRETPMNIPIKTTPNVIIAQLIVIILAIITQFDILIGIKMIILFPIQNKKAWKDLITNEANDVGDQPRAIYWYLHILLPNLLKIFEGLLILIATFIVIIQSDSVVDLLKDFAALFVISFIDNTLFKLANEGYCGKECVYATNEVKEKKLEDHKEDAKRSVLVVLVLVMLSIWVYFTSGQLNGNFVKEKYPLCPTTETIEYDGINVTFKKLIGDGKCQFTEGKGPNTQRCGWDGGDCEELNNVYEKCVVDEPIKLGDDQCNLEDEMYNSIHCGFDNGDCTSHNADLYKKIIGEDKMCMAGFPDKLGDGRCDKDNNVPECNFDAGDCKKFNFLYPKCDVDNPEWVGDGAFCHGGSYNTEECNFDGGDCTMFNSIFPDCHVDEPMLIVDGICQGGVQNTENCGWDGGDCLIDGYPNCHVDKPIWISNGKCDGREYNIEECGWDGGDCLIDGYPNCHVDIIFHIGDGYCWGSEYNTKECGWEGGDCVVFNEWYPTWILDHPNCQVPNPTRLGDGFCNEMHNTEECGWDGGDCFWFNEEYPTWILDHPNCQVLMPNFLGDLNCHGGEHNTEECGWDAGDCLEFNEEHPNCRVDDPRKIGNGRCNGGAYNTENCGWDGGDCI